MTDTQLRWQSARDAWQWADEIDKTRAMLEAVGSRYATRTAAPGYLLTTARDLLGECAEREVTDPWEVWSRRVGVYLGLVLGQFLYDWWQHKRLTMLDVTVNPLVILLVWLGYVFFHRRRTKLSRRRELSRGRTTTSPYDKARDHELVDDPSPELTVAYAGWRAGALAQSMRILLQEDRLAAARVPIAYEDDVCVAALYLTGATELLKGLSDYVEGEKSVANCGE
ncbi:hypothetical protein [Fodinicola acaciae]|uniref:hypothetical protein n=1 Tax=Fodinicola acaciae TaxID=2681555 RepID=UPI0013D365A2|nr:hypothetical protein [Fodinicola acaciae]